MNIFILDTPYHTGKEKVQHTKDDLSVVRLFYENF